MAVQTASGPEGARTLDLHNAIVALSQAELQAHDVWRAIHSLRITGAAGAAYSVRRRSSRTSSACALVAGAVPGLHCLRLTATMAYYFRSLLLAHTPIVKVPHILAVRPGVVKPVFAGMSRGKLEGVCAATLADFRRDNFTAMIAWRRAILRFHT